MDPKQNPKLGTIVPQDNTPSFNVDFLGNLFPPSFTASAKCKIKIRRLNLELFCVWLIVNYFMIQLSGRQVIILFIALFINLQYFT